MDSLNSLPSKRRRVDSPTSSTPMQLEITRSSPWFDDGNIILQAELAQFKVYSGILSAMSEVFRDMLSMPQVVGGDNSDEMVEGCPVVCLPDAAEDIRYVLEALYSGRNYSTSRELQPFRVLAAFLRLGKKYEILQLYKESLVRLSREFPSSLAEWEKARGKALEIEPSLSLAFDVINLARETGTIILLPAAFYNYLDCTELNVKDIFEGIKREDGSVALLSPEDQRNCITGWQEIVKAQARETFSWLKVDAFPCDSHDQRICCNIARQMHSFDLSYPIPCCHALDPWNAKWEQGLCSTCIPASMTSHGIGRRKMWNSLPSFFSLPPWEELLEN